MLATVKSGEAAARRDYRLQLVTERLTGEPAEDGFQSKDMERGVLLEADAFAAFESVTGELARRVGFLAHTEHMMGTSPDGIIGDYDGVLELKVPRSANHLRYLRAGVLPAEHVPQILHHLYITGARYASFVSFDPRFPPEMQVFHVRVERDETAIKAYEQKALAFLAEVDQEVAALRTVTNLSAVLTAAGAA